MELILYAQMDVYIVPQSYGAADILFLAFSFFTCGLFYNLFNVCSYLSADTRTLYLA